MERSGEIKVAGTFTRALLKVLGARGITMPWMTAYVKPDGKNDRVLLAHERYHLMAQREDGSWKWFLRYIKDWVENGYEDHPEEKAARRYAEDHWDKEEPI